MHAHGRRCAAATLVLLVAPLVALAVEAPAARVVSIEAATPDALGLAAGLGDTLRGLGLEVRLPAAPDAQPDAAARAARMAVNPDVDLRLVLLSGSDSLRTYYRPGGLRQEEGRRAAEGLHAALLEALRASAGGAWPDGGVSPCGQCLPGSPAVEVAVDPGPATLLADPAARLAFGTGIADGVRLLGFGELGLLASKGELVSPAPGSTLQGPSATFTWTAGADALYYYLMVGNWVGGNTLFSSDMGTQTTATVVGLPTDGRDIYVRLWSFIAGVWQSGDYVYKAAGYALPTRAGMLSPAPGAFLPPGSIYFQWTAGSGVQRYHLFIGEWPGGNTIYSADQGVGLSTIVAALPQDGRPLYVRLWSYISGAWLFNDYTYRAAGVFAPALAQIISPAPGSKLGASSLTFTWSSGSAVGRYALHIGSWQGGNNLYSGDLGGSLGAAVSGLPSDGSTLYVRLWSYINGVWQPNDFTYTAPGAPLPFKAAEITTPAPDSTLASAAITFSWTPGQGVSRYFLMIGSWPGGNNYFSADEASALSATVTGLPADGSTVYARLWSFNGSAWVSKDFQYKAAGR